MNTAKNSAKNSAKTSGTQASGQAPEKRQSDLDRRYGRIAISAVVAALPYRSETKNLAYARVEAHD